MSKCNENKCKCNHIDHKYFKYANNGLCSSCHPGTEEAILEQTAQCPPIGPTPVVTMMAPVVFDEAGLNLCRVFCIQDLANVCERTTNRTTDIIFDGLNAYDLTDAVNLQVQVVDINFNFVCPESYRYSEIKPRKNTPNLSRVTLKDIDVTLAIQVIGDTCKVKKEGMITLRYLPEEGCPGYDKDTNPSSVSFDLYTPYGISYAPENPAGCNKLVPTINYIGFVEGQHCQNADCDITDHKYREFEANNSLRQGISAQALAKVVAADDECFAIGLTLYIKSVYFVQYRFKNEGLCIPPKFLAINGAESGESSCKQFCKGELLAQSITPLDVCEIPRNY